MKPFTILPLLAVALATPAFAESLKIQVHPGAQCVDKPMETVQHTVADYENYPCYPHAKLNLSSETAGFTIPEAWDYQIAALVHASTSNASPAEASKPAAMRNRWVWMVFQPLNLGCAANQLDSPACQEVAKLYPRFLAYCEVTVSPDGATITNHCKQPPRTKKDSESTLRDPFAVESYESKTVVSRNGCQPGQTMMKVDIEASLNGDSLNQAIDRSSLNLIKGVIEKPLFQTHAYNYYFGKFNEGFLEQIKNPRTCTIAPAPVADLSRQ